MVVEILELIKCKRDGLMVSGCPFWDKYKPAKLCDLCLKKEKKDDRKNGSKKCM